MRSQVQILDGPHAYKEFYVFFKAVYGGIAQLVEHCFCTAGVSGSNPLTSIKYKIRYSEFYLDYRFILMLKKLRACEGSLGIQKRRRTWLPTKHFGELEASFDPEVSE